MILEIPKNAEIILHILEKAGYEAYVVGGCVRDSILGRSPDDWDITTSAKPEQVKALFHRTVDTGLQHGTVTVLMEKEGYEVTTYRVDGEYEDGRHPKEVTFTASLEEDLKRRDFTILLQDWWTFSADWRILKEKSSAVWETRWSVLQRMHCGSCVQSVSVRSWALLLKKRLVRH